MSTFRTSRGTRGQHVSPMYTSKPYKQHPGRREHIYGKVKPMDSEIQRDVRVLIGGAMFGLMFVVLLIIANLKGQ